MLKTTQKQSYKDISLVSQMYKEKIIMTKDAYEMFELISGVYFGKQYYFEQNNGIVYSRLSHSYMTKDDALKEFLDEIQSYE